TSAPFATVAAPDPAAQAQTKATTRASFVLGMCVALGMIAGGIAFGLLIRKPPPIVGSSSPVLPDPPVATVSADAPPENATPAPAASAEPSDEASAAPSASSAAKKKAGPRVT